jgi:hypothetical protein
LGCVPFGGHSSRNESLQFLFEQRKWFTLTVELATHSRSEIHSFLPEKRVINELPIRQHHVSALYKKERKEFDFLRGFLSPLCALPFELLVVAMRG